MMSKSNGPPAYGPTSAVPPPSAPPSYAQAVGGVPPASPFTPGHSLNPPHYSGLQDALPVRGHRCVLLHRNAEFGMQYLPADNVSAGQYQPGSLGCSILNRPGVSPGPAIVTTVVPVGPHPTHMICPSCHAEVDTSTRTEPGPIAYISGVLIALFGCWLGCCLIPCCIDECMDVHHTCPHCKAYLGRFRR